MNELAHGSGQQTASALIRTGRGRLHSITVVTDGTNAVSALDIYDAVTATGKRLIPTAVITTSAIDRIQKIPCDDVEFVDGCYVAVTCVGTVKYTVNYKD